MLQALELENFKAFGKRAHIPLAPITLIFGENSAGKSSILQALYLLKQTRESRETSDLLLTRTDNGIVDLGSFQEMLFNHDLDRTLSIRVKISVDSREKVRLPNFKSLGIEFNFKRLSSNLEVLLDHIGLYDGETCECLAKFQPSNTSEDPEDLPFRLSFLSYYRGVPLSKLAAVKCFWITEEREFWEKEFDLSKKNKNEIIGMIKNRIMEIEHTNEDLSENDQRYKKEIKFLKDEIDFYLSKYEIDTYISRRRNEEMDIVIGAQGFLPITVRKRSLQQHRAFNTFDVSQLVITASRILERSLEAFFPMGPFRRPPERWYIFRGTSPQDVGYRGDLLPDLLFRQPKLVIETNDWLKRLDIGYRLKVQSVGKKNRDLFEVRLIDTQSKDQVEVALPDVGYGISQLLPFVVQSLVSEKQIISIEQPEVHVHPRLQADLGDLLAHAIKKPRLNQFIIETHSEHLILRLQRLVRENLLKPEDISVIYISKQREGAKALRLHLDEDGDFIDDWPNGFFPERLRELI